MKFRLGTALLVLIFISSFISPVNASKGGIEQENNQFVVGFTYLENGIPSLCNGALIAPDLIATARHCLVNQQGVFGTNYVFSAPGAKLDSSIDGAKVPTGIKKIIIPQQSPIQGVDSRLDLAFIVTDKPFATGKPISIAGANDISSFNENTKISGYGYGAVFETGAQFSSLPRKFELPWKGSYLIEGSNSLFEILSSENAGCLGDSGGPITYQRENGEEVLIGVISVAGEVRESCGTKAPDGFYHLRLSAIYPYMDQIPKTAVSSATKPKVKKIICVKGVKKKVVKGVNPKCPKGYRLRK